MRCYCPPPGYQLRQSLAHDPKVTFTEFISRSFFGVALGSNNRFLSTANAKFSCLLVGVCFGPSLNFPAHPKRSIGRKSGPIGQRREPKFLARWFLTLCTHCMQARESVSINWTCSRVCKQGVRHRHVDASAHRRIDESTRRRGDELTR